MSPDFSVSDKPGNTPEQTHSSQPPAHHPPHHEYGFALGKFSLPFFLNPHSHPTHSFPLRLHIHKLKPNPAIPFAGRLGGNQEFILDKTDPSPRTQAILSKIPDAAPWVSFSESINPNGFLQQALWKAAMVDGVGTLLLTYSTVLLGISPSLDIMPLPTPSPTSGPFSTTIFLGPLVGAVTNAMFLSLFIYCFGGVSGAHLNPLITMGTLFARLTSLPRATLYMSFQVLGGTLAGLLIRASYGGRSFKVGGCYRDEKLVSVSQAFTIEFMSCLTLLFLAFGVGLDPRQRTIFGPALSPILVGFSLGVMTITTAMVAPGYGGAGMNAARCFGVFVGSGFKGHGWHWIHWMGALVASILHALIYCMVPPWSAGGTANEEQEAEVDASNSGGQLD